jgi:hypothetical protein
VRQYILDSWDGNIPTPKAFWVNLVLVQLVVGALFGLLLIPLYVQAQAPPVLVDVITLGVMGILLFWAGVGIWRSSDKLEIPGWKIAARAVTVVYVGLFLWSVLGA